MEAPDLRGRRVQLRAYRREDAPALVVLADDRSVWRNLLDRFPHPYTLQDAHDWIAAATHAEKPIRHVAIEGDGELVGGAGFDLAPDGRSAEIGYWLGAPFWERGYATEALDLLTDHAFASCELDRLEAHVFHWNPASMRVLEKVGYRLEQVKPRSLWKDGQRIDLHLYVRLRGDRR